MARPSKYSQKIADEICERLAEGESLRVICSAEEMPNRATVFRWLSSQAEFRDQYAHAREEQAERMLDEIIEIADDTSQDTTPKVDKEGNEYGEQANSEWIARSRLRVDARKWAMSKLAPKKYGDKVALTGDGGGPIQIDPIKMLLEQVEGSKLMPNV